MSPTDDMARGFAPRRAVVVGATGGIGAALVDALSARQVLVYALSRSAPADQRPNTRPLRMNLDDDESIASAARSVCADGPPDLLIVATGLLHDFQRNIAPEKTLRAIDRASLEAVLSANTIGPAMVARHFLPLMPRNTPSVASFLSARVGSISDNRLGGWHAYRASKAALNMMIRNWAIEMARTHAQHVCIGLHPGTVATGLSLPFRRSVPESGLFSAARAAEQLLDVIGRTGPEQSGRLFDWAGAEIAP